MKKKRNYVSPLWLQSTGDDDPSNPTIIIPDSWDTGGAGDCFTEEDMLTGMPGAKVYFNQGGQKIFVGYHQVREGAEDYDQYYDTEGNPLDLCEWMCDDFSMYVGQELGYWCE